MHPYYLKRIDFHDVIECLIAAIEARDAYTSGHSTRVADTVLAIAARLGIAGHELDTIHMAAHMHDIGKIGIPDSILGKPGRLSESEWEIVKRHPKAGYDILCRSDALNDIAHIVLHHHERWDGRGYPEGLSREAIPLGSRIIAVADSMDAMLSERPYKKALTFCKCMRELENNKGRQFDPSIIDFVLQCSALNNVLFRHYRNANQSI
jgi:HD-GYP domain-containing protein (c-di-GMP phosphodiesterase class II)